MQAIRAVEAAHNRLEFQDWAILKRMWNEFSDLNVNSNRALHPLRPSAFEYERETNEQGRKEIQQVGVSDGRREGRIRAQPLGWNGARTCDEKSSSARRSSWGIALSVRRRAVPNPTNETFLPNISF